ncbi:MAG TPA: GNAT family N-acetyltransferase [Longimicrobiales bacterium]
MPVTIRRLGPGDENILAFLAEHDAELDLEGRGSPRRPLASAEAAAYLRDPAVLHWVAYDGDDIVGFLLCHVLPLRSDDVRELLLYEIGIHVRARRRGIGRALADEMKAWMREHDVRTVWVCADNGVAVSFYRACGFEAAAEQPVYMEAAV